MSEEGREGGEGGGAPGGARPDRYQQLYSHAREMQQRAAADATRPPDVERYPFEVGWSQRNHCMGASLSERYPFEPDIGKSKLRPALDGTQRDFCERLCYDYENKVANIERLRSKHERDRDGVTGQDYFAPLVGRGPVALRNQENLPIHEVGWSQCDHSMGASLREPADPRVPLPPSPGGTVPST